jgi:hypothetical protein
MLLVILRVYTFRVDTKIYRLCRSVTVDYVGTEVHNPIVIVHVRGFPPSVAFGACAFDSGTSTSRGKTEIEYFVQNDYQKITTFLAAR